MRQILMAAILISVCYSYDQVPGAKQDHPILLTGGMIHPVSSEAFTGDLLFEDGVILEMGTSIKVKSGMEVIDISGLHIYPGLISAGTTMGLVEIGAVRATIDTDETGTVNPNVHAERAYNPDSEEIPVTRSNGVLAAQVIPQGGLISGTSAVMLLDGWTWEDCILKADAGLHINWPSSAISQGYWVKQSPEEQKKSNQKKRQKLDEILEDVRAYKAAADAGTQKGIDSRWMSMLPILDGSMPVFIHAQKQADIEAAILWSVHQNLRMILVGGADSWRCTDLLQKYNIPVIYQHPHSVPLRRWEKYDSRYTVPAKLYENGVQYCITGSNTYANQRNLPYAAGMAASYGLPQDEALKAVTVYAADILGIGGRMGTLETGKDASIIITDGDLIEIFTDIEMAYIQGRKVDLNDRHKMLRDKYMERYEQQGILK